MTRRLLLVSIEHEQDVVLVRQRARQLSELLGFDKQDQTRIATAVSEIARNAFEYGRGGRAEFFLIGNSAPQLFEVLIKDSGRGIADLKDILSGLHRSRTGMGVGIVGAQRLMDQFKIESQPGEGTQVWLRKFLPPQTEAVGGTRLGQIVANLAAPDPLDPMVEIRRQNRELMLSLEELRRRQDELEELNQELEDTNRGVVALYAELDERADHLRRADELKSRFLSNMSHEFRTPLNSIMALSRLVLDRTDGELSEEQEKQLKYIRKAAENLTELVNDLLDLAKVEAGKIDVRPAEFVVENLFGALRGMLRPLLVGDAVALVFEDASGLPPLYSDEGKVSQILRNFISNALKFTDRGAVRISANQVADDMIVFAVADTGIGIPEEHHETVFEEFVQIDHPAQRHYKGTGLGLPLSRKLAELLGGRISLESEVGQGAVFSLHLPRVHRKPVEPVAEPVEIEVVSGRVPVLAIEDDPGDLLVYEKTFAQSIYQLYSARNLAQARQLLKQITPAAILLDLMLFGEDAWRFLAGLKQDPAFSAIPVIVISTIEEEPKARKLGVDHYLLKPTSPAEVRKALARVREEKSRTRVLLIEDEEAFRYAVRQFLPGDRYEVVDASTGREGLRLARETAPDVVLLDLNLPEINGFDLLAELATDGITAALPVVVITASSIDGQSATRLQQARQIIAKSDLSTELLTTRIAQAIQAAERGARP
jgi:signal transduction histidine kinase/CheY-like chemotaxis protein